MAITAQRTACLKYTLTPTIANSFYNVFNLDLTEEYAGGQFDELNPIDVVLPDEGVYIVQQLHYAEESPTLPIYAYYTIIEECQLIQCLLKLFPKMFCIEPCACDDCDKSEIEKIRYELNKLVAGYGMYMLMIFAERVNYYDIIDIDDCRTERLTQIDKWITDLKEIKKRCGPDDCGESSQDDDTECSSC